MAAHDGAAGRVRVGVFGPAGRMGSETCRAVVADAGTELVAAIDPHRVGLDVRQITGVDTRLQVLGTPEALADASADVAVEFSPVEAALEHLRWCADHGVHAVVGTTGFTDEDLGELRSRFESGNANCLVAPNFAIGAVLMMRFAELAAPWFDSAEIVEMHHDAKRDAPSGTALRTAERMAAASREWAEDPTEKLVVPGARGAAGPAGIPIHSLRLRGAVAHQEVVLGTTGQSLTIRHDSYDRSSFMPGVLLAIRRIGELPGLTIGLDALLDAP